MEIVGNGHLEFDNDVSSRSVQALRIDLEWVDHINIYALVGMATAIMSAAKRSLAIEVNPPRSASACAFMSRLGFDKFVRDVGGVACDFSVTSKQSPSDVLVELKVIDTSADLIPLGELLWMRLDRKAGPQAQSALCESMWELGANVTEHSGSSGVCAAVVQNVHKRRPHLAFAMGDAGIGIRQSFLSGTGKYHPSTDHEAISLALKYQVSSVDDPGRGLGLASVVDDATGLGGRVLVRSGDARRTVTPERDGRGVLVARARAASVPKVEGTLVAVDVPCR